MKWPNEGRALVMHGFECAVVVDDHACWECHVQGLDIKGAYKPQVLDYRNVECAHLGVLSPETCRALIQIYLVPAHPPDLKCRLPKSARDGCPVSNIVHDDDVPVADDGVGAQERIDRRAAYQQERI